MAVKKLAKKAVKKTAKVKTVKKVAPKAKPAKKSAVKPAKKNIQKVAAKKPVPKVKNVKPVAKKPLLNKKPVVAKVAPLKKPVAKKPVAVKPVSAPVVAPVTVKAPAKKPVVKKSMKAERDNMLYDQEQFSDATIKALQAPSKKKATTLLGSLEFTPYQPADGEEYMGDKQKDHFRKILDAWKQQLMQDVDLTVGHLKAEAVFYADPVDRASQEEGFALELRTRDRERKLIKKIEQSLDLLNTGDYGYCEDCGADIGIRRLEARPTAVKCIDCKTFQEIREKQLGN